MRWNTSHPVFSALCLLYGGVAFTVGCSGTGGDAGDGSPADPLSLAGPEVAASGASIDDWLPRELGRARYLRRDVAADRIEDDLELVLGANLVIARGDTPDVALTVFNRSEARGHAVVKPSDGSSEGWREPEIRFDVEVRKDDGVWRPASRERYGRCGSYDEDWAKDVVTLGPLESLALPDVSFPFGIDIDDASEVRITAHYRYGVTKRIENGLVRWRRAVTPPAEIAGEPEFELVSRPVIVRVDPIVTLELTPSLDVIIENRTDVTQPIADRARIDFDLLVGDPDAYFKEERSYVRRITVSERSSEPPLAPRERRVLERHLTDLSTRAAGDAPPWTRVTKVRALYDYVPSTARDGSFRIVSTPWLSRSALRLAR